MILIFIVDGANEVISFCMRSAIPGYIVEPNHTKHIFSLFIDCLFIDVPPESTVLAYKSLRMSISHFMIEL